MNFLKYLKINRLFTFLSNQGFIVRMWSAKTHCLSLSIAYLSIIVFSSFIMFSCGPRERFWINTQQSGPSPRDDHKIVYDSFNEKIVLFGGWAGGDKFGDTWVWDGQKWSRINSYGPESRISHSMTYDGSRKKVILFGGRNSKLFGDTWEWDGSNWEQTSESGPPARCDHSMVFDEARKTTVLFGGFGGGVGAIIKGEELTAPRRVEFPEQGLSAIIFGGGNSEDCKWFDDTWEWNGQIWKKKSDSGPGARYNHSMAYDSKRKKVILFGGIGEEGKILGDTWVWDGSNWNQLSNSGPPPRFGHTLVYDEMLGKVILFGGSNSNELNAKYEKSYFFSSYETTHYITRNPMADIWEFDGSTWGKSEYPGPPARYFHSMAYDAAQGKIVLFGGHSFSDRLGDTWEYR